VFDFYQGPQKLLEPEQLVIFQSPESTLHFVVYDKDAFKTKDTEAMRRLKNFRKFNTKNTDKQFHLKFWMCDDEKLAKGLGIDTSKSGDIYLLREAETALNQSKKNTEVAGYPFTSSMILSHEEIQENVEKSFREILNYAINVPIIINDAQELYTLRNKFTLNILLVYCNPEIHGRDTYNELLRSLAKARQMKPIDVNGDKDDETKKEPSEEDILFVMCTEKKM